MRLVTGRNNQRLYRTAWSILKDRSEAEEAVQDGYMKAFNAIKTFAGTSSLSTWLTQLSSMRHSIEDGAHKGALACLIKSRFSSWRNIGKSSWPAHIHPLRKKP